MILDVNLLLFAVDEESPFHTRAREWLVQRLNESRRVAIPWQTIGGFLRIVTHPRALDHPLGPGEAMALVDAWLERDVVWIPTPGPSHAVILKELVELHDVRGNLMPDAQLAALAIEHGLTVCSADSDFARFGEIEWINPLAR